MIDLVPFAEDHFDLLIEWTPDAEFLMQWAGPRAVFPLDHAQLREWLVPAESVPPDAYFYSARGGDGRIIGHGELLRVDHTHKSAWVARILVGPPELRGQGYGEAIVRELVRIGFEELGLQRLELAVFDFNHAAIRCYERIGFKMEGKPGMVRVVGDEEWIVRVMGLLRDEVRPVTT
ncbi:MAG: GNAT family N-acetyltransferase [Caldilineales bacterium]|nr:GNAT family N-acetyltransferase [Caldilineales bacterium]